MTAGALLAGLLIGLVCLTALVMFVTWLAYETVDWLRERDARLDREHAERHRQS